LQFAKNFFANIIVGTDRVVHCAPRAAIVKNLDR